MPVYKIVIKRSAEKEISSLPLNIVEKIYTLLAQLSINPRPSGVKKLSGHTNL